MMRTDTELLNWLQHQLEINRYTGMALFRISPDRGMRLYETTREGAVDNIRVAIGEAMEAEQMQGADDA